MYTTALLQAVARMTDADFVTSRRSNGWIIKNGACVPTFPPAPECFRVDQVGVIQGEYPGSKRTVNLGKFRYIGNDNWLPDGPNAVGVRCMQLKLAGYD